MPNTSALVVNFDRRFSPPPLFQPRKSFNALWRRSNKTLNVGDIYFCFPILSSPTYRYLINHICHGQQHNIHPPGMAAFQRTRDDMPTTWHHRCYVSHLQYNLAYNIYHDILNFLLLPMGKGPTMAIKLHLSRRELLRTPEVRILPRPTFFPGFIRRLNCHISLCTPRSRLLDREKSSRC